MLTANGLCRYAQAAPGEPPFSFPQVDSESLSARSSANALPAGRAGKSGETVRFRSAGRISTYYT